MLDLQPIIRKVQKLRKRKGLNQQQFAEYLGVSLATITRWGRGGWEFTPSLAQLANMAELFKTTVPELLTVNEAAPALPLIPDTSPEATDTPADIVTNDEKPKPWEALGMSRAWYYRLRQQGRLDEYLKSREKQPDGQ